MSRAPEDQELIDAMDAEITALQAELEELRALVYGDDAQGYSVTASAAHGAPIADTTRRWH